LWLRESAQIRKHIAAVIVIPCAGALERIQFSSGERCGSDWQGYGLIQPLLARKTDTPLTSLIRMFITVASPAFYASPQRWIITTVWYEIPNDHFALFSHAHLMVSLQQSPS
jgi:hypothetical protein